MNLWNNFFGNYTPKVSYAEDKRRVRILKETPDSEEAKVIRRDRWNNLSFLQKILYQKEIRLFKFLYDSPAEIMASTYLGLEQSQKEKFNIYCLNPEYYNKKLE